MLIGSTGTGEREVDDEELLAEINASNEDEDEDYFAEDYIRNSSSNANNEAASNSRRTSTDVMWGGYTDDKVVIFQAIGCTHDL